MQDQEQTDRVSSDGSASPHYRRILLKLSGEAFAGDEGQGLDYPSVDTIAGEVVNLQRLGVEVAVVVGGGNIVRGRSAADKGVEQVTGHYMGMLATIINALAFQDALEKLGVETRVQSAISVVAVAEPYIRRRALRHLEKGRVVIFAAGTGNPYFTTDTAAALRASEIGADAVLMAKNGTDGVYDKDPRRHSDAVKFDTITYTDAISRQLKVMDLTAFTFCMENKMPIVVFDINVPGSIVRVAQGERIGTLVS
ncbi:MAG TPA: UMP kinase [Capsulimonadaceae bacterium]|nr:UMP kinase [Capsulimonadaceae bacterium]